MKNILFLILAAVIMYGCTDDNPVNSTSVGKGYFPLTLGSSWKFEIFITHYYGQDTVIFKDSITDEKMYEGLKYAILDTKVSDSTRRYLTNTGLYRRSNDTIYKASYFYYADTLANGDYPIIESVFLIERKGATWEVTIPVMPNSYTQSFTVIDKGIKHKVDSTVYNDVLHIHVVNTVANNTDTTTVEWDQFYAKDIGLIQNGKTNLKSYSIK